MTTMKAQQYTKYILQCGDLKVPIETTCNVLCITCTCNYHWGITSVTALNKLIEKLDGRIEKKENN